MPKKMSPSTNHRRFIQASERIGSRQNGLDDLRRKLVGQPLFQSVAVEDQVAIVHAEQVKHGGMKIVHADAVLYGFVPEVIGRPVSDAGFDAASGHPQTEAAGTM